MYNIQDKIYVWLSRDSRMYTYLIESNREEYLAPNQLKNMQLINKPYRGASRIYIYRMRIRLISPTFLVAKQLFREIPASSIPWRNTMYRETRRTDGFARVQETTRKPGIQAGREERNFVESRDH